VSRGELVEIGGGFRVPEILSQSGCRLVDVGTTNRTRIADYAAALDANPDALLLRVHRSNFALVGFTEMPSVEDLARLARERKVYLLHDLGSGALDPGLGEFTAAQSLREGADLVLISGDKLLGGPQAGILLGRRELVEKCRRHPLSRALRVDRMLLAALEATLRLYREGRAGELPALAAIHAAPDELRQRATKLALALAERGVEATVVETEGQVGGGSLPLRRLPGAGVALAGDAAALLPELRAGTPPVVALLREGKVVLDVRCVGEVAELASAVASAAERAGYRAASLESATLEEDGTEV
jgi:L-seryl-tRNA(Ser) seleniumtransferase